MGGRPVAQPDVAVRGRLPAPWIPEGMRTIAPGVHVLERDLQLLGLEFGARMTVLETDRGLLVHSPVDVDPDTVAAFGSPRWVLAPNKFHHLYVGRWAAAGLEAWAARGLPEKRPDVRFAGVVQPETAPFGDDIAVLPLTCFPLVNEVVVLHRPSRTLVVTDLLFNLAPTAPFLTRAAMWCSCGYPGCRSTALERVGMKRDLARRELGEIGRWDFDRIVMAHGDVVETDGKAAFRRAYAWLGIPWA